MGTLFLICAVVGGTILVIQFVLTVIGFGSEAFDVDIPFESDGDLDFDVDTDVGDTAGEHVSSSWLFGVISFRTIVAALAFFGLGGLAARAAELGLVMSLVVAMGAGLAAMYGVFLLFDSMKKLSAEGTVRIKQAIGKYGTVYTTIPAEESGVGKIQLNLQNRTMEYLAQTPGHAIAPGTKVVVTDIVTSDTVTVEPVLEN
jgi:hypothetical protein